MFGASEGTVTASAEDLSGQISDCLADRASMIYFLHHTGRFHYFKLEDQQLYQTELLNIRRQLRSGVIEEVKAGDDFVHGNVRLYPMLVKFQTECPAHFLLQKRGLIDDLDYTPYYFKGQNARNKALAFITKTSNRGV